MHINVYDLKNDLFVFNDIIKKYENNVINLYYILDKAFDYWKDAFSSNYYDDLCDEKKKAFEIIDDIKFIRNIYKYIENKYSMFGKKLDFSLEKSNELVELFNSFIGNISQLTDKYNNLNLSFGPGEYFDIISQKNNSIDSKNKLIDVKNKYIHNFNLINDIEKNVFFKISKFSVDIVKVKNLDYINSNINSNISVVYIGKEELKRIVESSIMFVEEQELLISNFSEIYDNIRNCYISDNSKVLNSLWLQVIDNMNSVVKYYLNFIDVLSYIISLYDVVVEDYDKTFKAIENSATFESTDILGNGDVND